MNGRRRLEYWPELVLLLLMLTVLVLDLALFHSLWPFGENGANSAGMKVH